MTLKSADFWPDGFDGDLDLEDAGKGHSATIHTKLGRYKGEYCIIFTRAAGQEQRGIS